MLFRCYILYGIIFFRCKNVELSFIPFITATVGFWGSLVYYNSYLPEIAEEKDQDAVSAKGFALGYFGSSLLLIICLGIILGVGKEYSKYSFLLVGLWWMGFAQYTFKNLPNSAAKKEESGRKRIFYKGFNEIKKYLSI